MKVSVKKFMLNKNIFYTFVFLPLFLVSCITTSEYCQEVTIENRTDSPISFLEFATNGEANVVFPMNVETGKNASITSPNCLDASVFVFEHKGNKYRGCTPVNGITKYKLRVSQDDAGNIVCKYSGSIYGATETNEISLTRLETL